MAAATPPARHQMHSILLLRAAALPSRCYPFQRGPARALELERASPFPSRLRPCFPSFSTPLHNRTSSTQLQKFTSAAYHIYLPTFYHLGISVPLPIDHKHERVYWLRNHLHCRVASRMTAVLLFVLETMHDMPKSPIACQRRACAIQHSTGAFRPLDCYPFARYQPSQARQAQTSPNSNATFPIPVPPSMISCAFLIPSSSSSVSFCVL